MSPEPPNVDRLYEAHAQALFAFVQNLLRSEADTRDVLQEVFLRLAREPRLLRGVQDERAFVLRLAHNKAVDLIRRRGARERKHDGLAQATESVFAPSGQPDEQTFREALSDAMADLPTDQRAVVHLKLWEGLTFDAIAETLEIPLNTAASRYRYALDKLRERLRPIYNEIK
jgi:RNA polymerase sigma-70 factor (ECF subfamily)